MAGTRNMLLSVICALAFAAPSFATSMALEIFNKGNNFYEKTEYDSAIAAYEKILGMGLHDSRVYFNLGDAYFKKNSIGRAVLCFEKARLLDPADKDVSANLKFAYMSTVDKIPPRETGFFMSILYSLHTMFSIKTQSYLFIAFLYLLTVSFLVFLFGHPRFRSTMLALCIVMAALWVLLSASFFYKAYHENRYKEAIVLSEKVNVRNAPDGDQVLFSVHEGAKFTLIRSVGPWYYAALENGMGGWVQAEDLGIIEIE